MHADNGFKSVFTKKQRHLTTTFLLASVMVSLLATTSSAQTATRYLGEITATKVATPP